MRTQQVIAAALLAVAGASAFAAGPAKDYISPARLGTSVRTREAVVAEVANLRATGQLQAGGDVVEKTPAPVVIAEQQPLTRAEVKAAVAQARIEHKLVYGDMM